jgi:hypothetical protein
MATIRVFFTLFPRWYFLEIPEAILKTLAIASQALFTAFPFPFLMRTLVSPWKSIRGEYPRTFSFNRCFHTWTLNLVSRGVGFTVRVGTIGVGFLFFIVLFFSFAAALLLWMTFPLLLVLAFRIP